MPVHFPDGNPTISPNWWQRVPYSANSKDIASFSERPIKVDIGTGFGSWLAEMSVREPQHRWLGIDNKWDRLIQTVTRHYSKWIDHDALAELDADTLKDSIAAAPYGVCPKSSNLRLACGDAREVLQLLPVASCQAFHLNFPEPNNNAGRQKYKILTAELLHHTAQLALIGAEFHVIDLVR